MLFLNYQIVFYNTGSGRKPVEEYLLALRTPEWREINDHIKLLGKHEGRLLAPYAKHIHKKIWELRIKYLNRQHRIFYFIAPKRKIILLSAFLKKTNKTPRFEIKKAYKYYLDYISRHI